MLPTTELMTIRTHQNALHGVLATGVLPRYLGAAFDAPQTDLTSGTDRSPR